MNRDNGDRVTLPREVVDEAIRALRQSYGAVLTVRYGSLDEPYRDEPSLTPYTRWMRPAGRRAHDACGALQRALREAGYEPVPPGSHGSLVALHRDHQAGNLCDLCAADEPGGTALTGSDGA